MVVFPRSQGSIRDRASRSLARPLGQPPACSIHRMRSSCSEPWQIAYRPAECPRCAIHYSENPDSRSAIWLACRWIPSVLKTRS